LVKLPAPQNVLTNNTIPSLPSENEEHHHASLAKHDHQTPADKILFQGIQSYSRKSRWNADNLSKNELGQAGNPTGMPLQNLKYYLAGEIPWSVGPAISLSR